MKKLVLLGLIAGAAYKAAKHYNINSLDDLKKFVMPEEGGETTGGAAKSGSAAL
jgi:hypothetical protein